MTLVADATAHQRRALEPAESVWVAASAGTGKTKPRKHKSKSKTKTGVTAPATTPPPQ